MQASGLRRAGACAVLLLAQIGAAQPYRDHSHPSRVFGEDRKFRLFLPPAYDSSAKPYPVIYYFHGHSDRYTLERYDNGADTVPKIAAFVSKHDVIVVAVDGYVAREYQGFYGGSPWDIRENGGDLDFGEYLKELIAHIDRSYRTLATRRYRATSGLSMGGFFSLYVSARYPDLIGSASSFNPGPEFYIGEKDNRNLWRPKDQVRNHEHTKIRLIRASGDYISQYHEETRLAYSRAHAVDFEYRQDEYHRHWATSIGETFDFHMRAFAEAKLDKIPERWSYSSSYRSASPWGYRMEATGNGLVYLDDVSRGGFRITTRKWAPDGPADPSRRVTLVTPPVYQPGARYQLSDYSFHAGLSRAGLTADAHGRLTIAVDGAGHQLSLAGPGIDPQAPLLLPFTTKDRPRVMPGIEVALPLRVYNPRATPLANVPVKVESEYPTVQFLESSLVIPSIEPGAAVDISKQLRARFTAGAGYFTDARIVVSIDGVRQDLDVFVAPDVIPAPLDVRVLDGRTVTFTVFRQKGNQGGGKSIERTVTEGSGNGNGILEPGEEAAIWVKLAQGMDPFDKNNWYRAKVFTDSPWIEETGDFQEQKQLEWTSAKERTSLIRLSKDTPPGTALPTLLGNESWSYHFTPDVRYGQEMLYQAYQLHSHHLHRWEIRTAQTPRSPSAPKIGNSR